VGYQSLLLEDSAGNIYLVGVNDGGLITIFSFGQNPQGIAPTSPVPTFIDHTNGTTYWQIGVNIDGELTTTNVLATEDAIEFWPLQSIPGGVGFNMGVDSFGRLTTQPIGSGGGSGQQNPLNSILGTVLPVNFAYINGIQPNGPFTQVTNIPMTTDPLAKTNGVYISIPSGRYFPGCGHSINEYLIQQLSLDGVTQAKAVTCPMCGYVQQLIVPAANYYDGIFLFPIITG